MFLCLSKKMTVSCLEKCLFVSAAGCFVVLPGTGASIKWCPTCHQLANIYVDYL